MIVKVKNGLDSWSYFECEIIHSKHTTLGKMISLGDNIVLFETQPTKANEAEKQVKVLNLETNKSHLRTIITDRVCYVLNNEGKTIDKI